MDSNTAASPSDKTTHAEASFSVRYPRRIVLAEDNLVNQKIGLMMLKRMGYAAQAANNGREVLELCLDGPVDLIFMDLQMPLMDGFEATRTLLATIPADQRPWIVALTAAASEADRQHCLDSGMNDYITKPFRPQDVMQVIEKSPGATLGKR